MIIFVNGPFGVGKTTAATLLVERIPHAMLYDPEVIGSTVRVLLSGVERADDFQDHALWRMLTVDAARRLRETTGRPLVVPMTVIWRDYYDVLIDGFRRIDRELTCVRLLASVEVLQRRIMESDEQQAAVHDWRLDRMDRGLAALRSPDFGRAIETDGRTPAEVVDLIVRALPLTRRRHIQRDSTAGA